MNKHKFEITFEKTDVEFIRSNQVYKIPVMVSSNDADYLEKSFAKMKAFFENDDYQIEIHQALEKNPVVDYNIVFYVVSSSGLFWESYDFAEAIDTLIELFKKDLSIDPIENLKKMISEKGVPNYIYGNPESIDIIIKALKKAPEDLSNHQVLFFLSEGVELHAIPGLNENTLIFSWKEKNSGVNFFKDSIDLIRQDFSSEDGQHLLKMGYPAAGTLVNHLSQYFTLTP